MQPHASPPYICRRWRVGRMGCGGRHGICWSGVHLLILGSDLLSLGFGDRNGSSLGSGISWLLPPLQGKFLVLFERGGMKDDGSIIICFRPAKDGLKISSCLRPEKILRYHSVASRPSRYSSCSLAALPPHPVDLPVCLCQMFRFTSLCLAVPSLQLGFGRCIASAWSCLGLRAERR